MRQAIVGGRAITVEQLAKLSGLTDRGLRGLAAAGWFSKTVEGHYELVPTIHGLLRWLFASPDRTLVNYDQQRAQHIMLQRAKLKVELRQLKVSQFQSRKSRT